MTHDPSSRRGFLRNLAGFTAAAPVAALPIIATAEPIVEDPAFRALGVRLDDAAIAHSLAKERFREAEGVYEARRSNVPSDLVIKDRRDDFRNGAETETRYSGKLPNPSQHRLIISADRVRGIVAGYDGRTREGRRGRRLLSIARRYEADLAALEEDLRLPALMSAECNAKMDLISLIDEEIMPRKALTLAGLKLKARAIVIGCKAYDNTDPSTWWGEALAENVIALDAHGDLPPTG